MDELTVDGVIGANADETIRQIMNRYGQDVLQLVYSYIGNRTIAEDLTQEIFIK